jgi:hypothetical protein
MISVIEASRRGSPVDHLTIVGWNTYDAALTFNVCRLTFDGRHNMIDDGWIPSYILL